MGALCIANFCALAASNVIYCFIAGMPYGVPFERSWFQAGALFLVCFLSRELTR